MMRPFFFIIFFFICGLQYSAAQQNPADNRNLGMCEMYADTVKLEDLACGRLSVRSDKKAVVTSFIFSYYLSDQMTLKLIYGFGDKLKDEEIKEMLSVKPKKIFLQEVLGESGTENLIIGYRTIHCK